MPTDILQLDENMTVQRVGDDFILMRFSPITGQTHEVRLTGDQIEEMDEFARDRSQ